MVNPKLTIETIACHQSKLKIILVELGTQIGPQTPPLDGIIFDAKPEDGFLTVRTSNHGVFRSK